MKQSKKNCDLQSCFLCRLSLKEWLPAIETHRKNISFKKGETIFKEGEEVTGIYFLYTGKIKVHKQWGEDKELIVRFARQGDILGHRGLGKTNFYPVSATALEPSILCFIGLDFFKTSLKVNNELAYNLLMFFAEELQESEKRMRNLAHMPVKGRIAYALLKLKEKFGVTDEGFIDITLSRQDIASYAGTTYETVFRILGDFVQEDIIKLADKNIFISNTEKLSGFTNENNW